MCTSGEVYVMTRMRLREQSGSSILDNSGCMREEIHLAVHPGPSGALKSL
jgi:hypothetical protein